MKKASQKYIKALIKLLEAYLCSPRLYTLFKLFLRHLQFNLIIFQENISKWYTV